MEAFFGRNDICGHASVANDLIAALYSKLKTGLQFSIEKKFRQQMTRLIAINLRCRHWLAWTALLLSCVVAAFASFPKEQNVVRFQHDLRCTAV